MNLKAVSALLCFALALGWAGDAEATPDFPSVVVQQLGLSQVTIDPPSGCKLCHVSEQGGTDLSSFGALLYGYGAQRYNQQSLRQALSEVQTEEPQLIDDVRNGVDPNAAAASTGNGSGPQYGCGLAPSGLRDWISPGILAMLMLGISRIRRKENKGG